MLARLSHGRRRIRRHAKCTVMRGFHVTQRTAAAVSQLTQRSVVLQSLAECNRSSDWSISPPELRIKIEVVSICLQIAAKAAISVASVA